MTTTTLPEQVPEPVSETRPEDRQLPKYLLKELQEIVHHTEAAAELVHWYHFVPCAGVRYYTYHISPSPVEPLVRRKG